MKFIIFTYFMEKSTKKRIKRPAPEKAKKATPKRIKAKDTKKSRRVQLKAVKGIKKPSRGRKKEIKDILFEMKARLMKEISEKLKTKDETLKAEMGDDYDIASWDRERDLFLLLGDRDRAKLMQIEEALNKIDEGVFGQCEECGEKISVDRLIAMPFAKVCVKCKSRMEEEEESLKSLEEEGTYQTPVNLDLDEDEG